MADVESSALSKRFLIIRADPSSSGVQPGGENGIYLGPDCESLSEAISQMDALKSLDSNDNYYVVEALASLPNPADS